MDSQTEKPSDKDCNRTRPYNREPEREKETSVHKRLYPFKERELARQCLFNGRETCNRP